MDSKANRRLDFVLKVLILAVLVTLLEATLLWLGYYRYTRLQLTAPVTGTFLPYFLMAFFLVSLLLLPIVVLVTLVVDDWRFSSLLGVGISQALVIATGAPAAPNRFAEIAFYGPAQLCRGLAVVLAGIEFPTPSSMAHYFGVYFTPADFAIPIVVYLCIACASIMMSSLVSDTNTKRWQLEAVSTTTIFSSPEKPQRLLSMKTGLKNRRRVMVGIVIGMFLFLPTVSFSYESLQTESSRVVLYESSESGLVLDLGEWVYGAFELEDPPVGVYRMIQYEVHILNWGTSPAEMRLTNIVRATTLSDFEQDLQNGSLDDIHSGSNVVWPETDYEGGWHGLPKDSGAFVWAVRFVDENWNVTSGTLRISLTVLLEDKR
jgi:hypothetical protein